MQKKLIHLLIVAFLLLPSLLLPHQAHACSCATPEFWNEWEEAEAVFIGTVTDIEYSPPAEIMSSGDPITYTFQVHTSWKGVNTSNLEVQSVRETDSCGAGFSEGARYMVYAFSQGDKLATSLCNYNHPAGTVRPYQRDILNTVQRIWSGLGLRAWEILY